MLRLPHRPQPYDDDWEDQPAQGSFYQYGLGVILPALLIALSVRVILQQHVTIPGRHSMSLSGANAIAFGIAWASAGVFIHCHYFWGNVYNQAWFAVLGKIVAVLGFIVGLAFVLFRNGRMGIN